MHNVSSNLPQQSVSFLPHGLVNKDLFEPNRQLVFSSLQPDLSSTTAQITEPLTLLVLALMKSIFVYYLMCTVVRVHI